ncbi:plasmolipin-like [Xenia sp. Carnegie-2017]|uniref:plasmolipin-like n=1 Tax=Xenia sp. Carnegie-2017 TaxID=2897299 RepID=UPI001F049A8D|nr:plasmolipin-like [Xenia sp. Carnegie-2017]
MGMIPKGTEYIKTVPFFLKIAEFVILLVAIGTLGRFLVKIGLTSEKSRLDFLMFAVVVLWIVVVIMAVLFVSGLHEKISIINWPLTVFISCLTWSVMLFIAGCLLADTVRKFNNIAFSSISSCDILDKENLGATCGHLIGATVCCFIASILFAVDAFFNFRILQGQRDTSSATASAPEKTST